MKPPAFEYADPRSLEEALELLRAHAEDARVLAGGQSLIPLLNFRLARPSCLIDLNRIEALSYIKAQNGGLAIGAMTRQRTMERASLTGQCCPILNEVLPHIGHVQIRNRGTIGGSLAHADPAAELPAVVSALGGEMVLRSQVRERILKPEQFFVGPLMTALEPDELLVELRLPRLADRTGYAFLEISRRHGDFGIVGVIALVTLDSAGLCTGSRVVLTGVGPVPVRATAAEQALVGERPDARSLGEAADCVVKAVRPHSDVHASADYRRRVAGVLTKRALGRAVGRLGGVVT